MDIEVSGHEREPSIARLPREPTRATREQQNPEKLGFSSLPMKLNVKFR